MAETIHYSLGRPGGLKFDLNWVDSVPADQTRSRGFGSLKVWVGAKLIWGRYEGAQSLGIEWYWDDLLDFLSQSWRFLLLDESYPLNLQPAAPQLLRAILRDRWLGVSEEIIRLEDNLVSGFEQVHDFAYGVQGVVLPTLFLLREGNFMVVATGSGVERLAFEETISTVKALGDQIAARLSGHCDARTGNILEEWQNRMAISDRELVEIVSALPRGFVESISVGSQWREFWEISNDNYEPNEIMAAARMVGNSLSETDTRQVLNSLKAIPHRKTEQLNQLSLVAEQVLHSVRASLPHEQGRHLAAWLRQVPEVVENDDSVDPEHLMKAWGVHISEIGLGSESLDALCTWGPRHGPHILVNTKGRLAHFPSGRRSSLAHEICHLLVDRKGSLPLVEALGGSVPRVPEQRANAFAAELLLPRDRAHSVLASSSSLAEALSALSERYDVSYEVAAWQILNSSAHLSYEDRKILLMHTYRFNRN